MTVFLSLFLFLSSHHIIVFYLHSLAAILCKLLPRCLLAAITTHHYHTKLHHFITHPQFSFHVCAGIPQSAATASAIRSQSTLDSSLSLTACLAYQSNHRRCHNATLRFGYLLPYLEHCTSRSHSKTCRAFCTSNTGPHRLENCQLQ